ncbi:MAG: lipid-A-disaccharide synthase [Phycisphaerales bacterium]|nr:lipid-A-disaccharide synthase [Phycisphaerales bacterium]
MSRITPPPTASAKDSRGVCADSNLSSHRPDSEKHLVRQSRGPLVFISAAELSADVHGAALIRATREACPDVRFVGIAGPNMVAAGCEAVYDMTGHAGMLLGAIANVGRGITMLSAADRYLRMYPFDAAVLIDSPTLHLPLAAKAQIAGVPVMYYIAPQMWAWGAYRIHKLRNRCDRVAVIFPFEEEYFRNQGVNARYVGHPLGDLIDGETRDPALVDEIRSLGSPVVALLPGSRKHVAQTMLPDQLKVAERIAGEFRNAFFGVSVAGTSVAPLIGRLTAASPVRNRLFSGHHGELIEAADLVLVASGTAALEVAFRGRPMVVMYQSSPLLYHLIARWMIHTPYLSLPNILANREIVPEFMPYYRSTEPIAKRAIELLKSDEERSRMVSDLAAVVEPLRGRSASSTAAAMLLDMTVGAKH